MHRFHHDLASGRAIDVTTPAADGWEWAYDHASTAQLKALLSVDLNQAPVTQDGTSGRLALWVVEQIGGDMKKIFSDFGDPLPADDYAAAFFTAARNHAHEIYSRL